MTKVEMKRLKRKSDTPLSKTPSPAVTPRPEDGPLRRIKHPKIRRSIVESDDEQQTVNVTPVNKSVPLNKKQFLDNIAINDDNEDSDDKEESDEETEEDNDFVVDDGDNIDEDYASHRSHDAERDQDEIEQMENRMMNKLIFESSAEKEEDNEFMQGLNDTVSSNVLNVVNVTMPPLERVDHVDNAMPRLEDDDDDDLDHSLSQHPDEDENSYYSSSMTDTTNSSFSMSDGRRTGRYNLTVPPGARRIDLGDESNASSGLDKRLLEVAEGIHHDDAIYDPNDCMELLAQAESFWYINTNSVVDGNHAVSQQAQAALMQRMAPPDNQASLSDKLAHVSKCRELADRQSKFLEAILEHVDLFSVENEIGRNNRIRLSRIRQTFNKLSELINTNIQMQATMMSNNGVPISAEVNQMIRLEDRGNIESMALTDVQKLMFFMGRQCASRNYKKLGDRLYKEATVMYNGREYKTHAYQEECTLREFMEKITTTQINPQAWFWRTKASGNADHVVNDFINNDERTCLKLVRDRRIWSFGNCIYDGNNDHIYPYENMDPTKLPQDRFSIKLIPAHLTDFGPIGNDYRIEGNKYINRFDKVIYEIGKDDPSKIPPRRYMDIPTPVFETLMTDQGWKRGTRRFAYESVGRLAFELGAENGGDNMQFVTLHFGKANTGKSTFATAACEMYEKKDIFELASAGEQLFGLQGAFKGDKKIWRLLELRGNLTLPESQFLLMVEGGDMSIAKKNGDAIEEQWKLPGMMVGNERVPYKDSQGSVTRRIVMFEYMKKLLSVDISLKQRLRLELPNLIRKSVRGYYFWRQDVGNKSIWTPGVISNYFHETNKGLRQAIDPVSKFLAERCDFANSVDRDPTHFLMPMAAFVKAMKEDPEMRSVDKEQLKVEEIISSLEAFGISCIDTRKMRNNGISGTFINENEEVNEEDVLACDTIITPEQQRQNEALDILRRNQNATKRFVSVINFLPHIKEFQWRGIACTRSILVEGIRLHTMRNSQQSPMKIIPLPGIEHETIIKNWLSDCAGGITLPEIVPEPLPLSVDDMIQSSLDLTKRAVDSLSVTQKQSLAIKAEEEEEFEEEEYEEEVELDEQDIIVKHVRDSTFSSEEEEDDEEDDDEKEQDEEEKEQPDTKVSDDDQTKMDEDN